MQGHTRAKRFHQDALLIATPLTAVVAEALLSLRTLLRERVAVEQLQSPEVRGDDDDDEEEEEEEERRRMVLVILR
jgi:hypothetical protein